MGNELIYRGGSSLESLFLDDDAFEMPDGSRVVVRKSQIVNTSMHAVVARHKARYGLVSLFCRPEYRVLDFPCGSGYAAPQLQQYGVSYEGRDIDAPTIEFARRKYSAPGVAFQVGDLRAPALGNARYDIIGCIEGLEHIEQPAQGPLVEALFIALKPGGTLIVSSPEAPTRSGPNPANPYHKGELTRNDFDRLLIEQFGTRNVEVISQQNILLSTGQYANCLYGVCHRS